MTRLWPALAALALAACGSSEPPPAPEADPLDFANYNEGQDAAATLTAQMQALGPAPTEDLPFVGQLELAGLAQISGTAGLDAVGPATVTIAWHSNSFSGEAGGFLGPDGAVEGALTLSSGSIDRDTPEGGGLTATVDGSFEGGTFLVLSSGLTGTLFGDAEALSLDGAVSGLAHGQPTTFDVVFLAIDPG